jgi:hypothetical protein
MFVSIYGMTFGQPCTDCAYKPCSQLHQFITEDKLTAQGVPVKPNLTLLTNKEMADKCGISKRQVSKLCIHGTNDIRKE